MNDLPRSWLSTTSLSTRLSKGKRRDSSVGLLTAAGLAGSGADGFGSPSQEISSAAAASSGRKRIRIRPQYNAPGGKQLWRRTLLPDRWDFVLADSAVRGGEHQTFRPSLRNQEPVEGRSEEHTSELQSLRHLVCR